MDCTLISSFTVEMSHYIILRVEIIFMNKVDLLLTKVLAQNALLLTVRFI